jgi:hypothetical protein
MLETLLLFALDFSTSHLISYKNNHEMVSEKQNLCTKANYH